MSASMIVNHDGDNRPGIFLSMKTVPLLHHFYPASSCSLPHAVCVLTRSHASALLQ